MMDILRKFLIYILLPSLISIAVGLALTHKLYPYISLILIIAIISTFIIILNLEWKLRKKLRHFEKLRKKSFPVDDNMNFYKGSSPRQEDIGSDRDVIRELHYKIFPQILETKNSQKNSYLSIIAPPQEGKSTLLLRFAKELVDKKQIVLWADATYKFAQENPFNELKLIRKCRKKRIFAIIDNIARLSRYSDFLQDLASQPNVKVTLIGTSRIGDWEKVKFEHPTGIEYLFENPDSKPRLPYKLKTTDSDIKAVVKKLREKGILKELKTPMSKPENFHILIWALAAPEGEENFSQRMLEEADSLTTLEKRVYCYVCALHRFGLPMPSPLIKRLLGKNIIGYLQTLVEKSVIRYIADDDSYISRHEVVAQSISRHSCPKPPELQPIELYRNILNKATLREEELIVLIIQNMERNLIDLLKNHLVQKYKITFSKSRSAKNLGLGWGPILYELFCYNLAKRAYVKSLNINKMLPETHNNYANLLYVMKKYFESEEQFKRALELNEENQEAHFNYAVLLAKLGRYKEAEQHFKRALELKKDFVEAHYNYANLLYEIKRYLDAEEHYQWVLALKEDHTEAHNNYGVLLLNLKRYPDAEKYFKRALELKKDFPEAHHNYALSLDNLKRWREAEVHYKSALKLKEDYPEAHFNYANLLIKLERHNDAEKHYKRAVELNENDPRAHHNYAALLFEKGKLRDAEEHMQKALELKENYLEAHYNYAMLLMGLRRCQEAEVHFKMVLELKEDYVMAMAWIGILYSRGDFLHSEKAIYWLKKAWEHRDKLPDKGQMVTKALEALYSEKGEKKEEKSPENEL